MGFRKGIAVWISGFFTFLASLNTFNAVMLWGYYGANFIVEPYYNVLGMGGMQVTEYFWVSLIAAFSFLGLTSLVAYGRSPYKAIVEMICEVKNELGDTRKKIDDANIGLVAKLEMDQMEDRQLSATVNGNIGNATREMLNAIDRQEKTLQQNREEISDSFKTVFKNVREEMLKMLEKRTEVIQKDLLSTTQANIGNIRKEMKELLEKQGKVLQVVEHSDKQSVAVLQRQIEELEYVKAELETLQMEFTLPKPRLNSQKGPEEIKGVGPRLGAELRCIGITNIGELITTDPLIIAEKTPISLDMATRFQARAQLLMIPGVDEIDAELLENVGIRSSRELASQNSIFLSRRIAELAKDYVEKGKIAKSDCPTIEEVSSWIKYANL